MADLDADALVKRWVVKEYIEARPRNHLALCPSVYAFGLEGYDGQYGCDTGCDFASIDFTVTCDHGELDCYRVGNFGDLAQLIEVVHEEMTSA